MEQINVTAQLREKTGVRGTLSKFRAEGFTPAVIYGLNQPPASITVFMGSSLFPLWQNDRSYPYANFYI